MTKILKSRNVKTDEREAMLECLDEGMSMAAVAARFDRSLATVSRVRAKNNTGKEAWKSAVVRVRLVQHELDTFDAIAVKLGRTRSDLMRHLIRQAGDLVEMDPELLTEIREIKLQLQGTARNLNQMTKAANRGQLSIGEQEHRFLDELSWGIRRISQRLFGLVAASQRRTAAKLDEFEV